MTAFDAAILDFVERWAPFGGGHEFILAEFGIDLGEFYRRVRRVLDQLDPGDCDPRVVLAVRHNHALHTGER